MGKCEGERAGAYRIGYWISIAGMSAIIASLGIFLGASVPATFPGSRQAGRPGLWYNVRDYGARGNGLTKDTAAIQAAIDAAGANGGGMVVLAPGKYLSGTLHLKSNVTLQLVAGAVLIASRDDADFDRYEPPPHGDLSTRPITWTVTNILHHPISAGFRPDLLRETIDNPDTTYAHYSLIVGDRASNVTIEGPGTIDGNRNRRGGPKLIALKRCRHVLIRDLTMRNSPSYNISLIGTDNVRVDGVRILDGYADGIDPDDSRDVRITNCYIDTWDDSICAKASLALGRPLATENLLVNDCILRTSSAGFKFGTESEGSLRNVTASNCLMMRRKHGRAPICGIEIDSVDGGKVDGVKIYDIVMRGVRTPIFLRLGNRGRGMARACPGSIKNINIDHVIAYDAARASSISGIPGFPIRNVSLSNIRVNEIGGGSFAGLEVPELVNAYPDGEMFGYLPAYSLWARHVDGLTVSNWRDRWEHGDPRPAAAFDEVKQLEVLGLRADRASGSGSVVMLHDVDGAVITRVAAGQPASSLIQVTGSRSRAISRFANQLAVARDEMDLYRGRARSPIARALIAAPHS